MQRTLECLIANTLTLTCALTFAVDSAVAESPAGKLPGSRPVIEAIHYPSLQAALDALPVEGGMVRLPAGEFEIEQPLFLRTNDTCLEGAGTATHIKNTNIQGQPAIVIEHPDGAKNRKTELWRIRLSNFRVTGNEKSGPGIDARRINEVFIDGVTVSYHGGDGIRLYYCYEDPRISDNLITYNKQTGLNLVGCHDIVVSANQFEENRDALRCIDSFNLTMTGNALDDHLGNGVIIENTYGSVVAGNMIEECQGAAAILDRDCYGITLSANVIAHNGSGILLRDAHGCTVSANTFTLMKGDALQICAASGRIAVAGNSFCDSYIGNDQEKRNADDRQAGGVTLDGTRDVGLVGNVLSGLRPKAVELGDDAPSERILFQNNVITDAESELP